MAPTVQVVGVPGYTLHIANGVITAGSVRKAGTSEGIVFNEL